MRILFLNDLSDPRIGSSVRQMYQEASRLRELGHETALATAVQDVAQATPTQILGLDTWRLFSDYNPRFRSFRSLDNPATRAPFARVLAEFRPDVVHSHLIHTHLSYRALEQARAAGAGVVFTAHDVMTFCYQKLTCFHGGEANGGRLRDYRADWQKCLPCQRLRYNPWRNARIRRVLERCVDRFTVVSDELGLAIRANGIRVDRTVHNAIQRAPRLSTEEELQRFRAKHGLVGMQVIAMGGRLHEQKGVAQLFLVLARLAPRFERLRLLVMGKREVYETEFRSLARRLGIEERIVPTGWLDGEELAAAYGTTDVFVTPSICFDTFGLVNLEAMEHGKPVVATSFGGSREVVVDGVTGYVANPFDLDDFSERVGRLLAEPALAARLGAAGRERLSALFSIERLTDEFLEEYGAAGAAAAARRSPRPR
jgi:glycosyltransferase involved in cell wall biosynthesis